MRPVRYLRAPDPAAAVAAVAAADGAVFLAGGTNLVDLMKLGVEAPGLLVDVSRLPLTAIEPTERGGLSIGAAVRNSDLAGDRRVRTQYPVLAQALLAGASGQLRNVATVGGNLLQRTRCLYFQDITKPCHKRVSGSGCPARAGQHRNLAILGGSEHCIATRVSGLCGGGVAGPGVVLDLIVWAVAWPYGRKSGLEELAAELGEHVGDRGFLLGAVPRAEQAPQGGSAGP